MLTSTSCTSCSGAFKSSLQQLLHGFITTESLCAAISITSPSHGCSSLPASLCKNLPLRSPWGLICTRWLACRSPAPPLHEVNIYSTVNGMLLSFLRFPTSYWETSQRQEGFFFQNAIFLFFLLREVFNFYKKRRPCIVWSSSFKLHIRAKLSIISMWIYAAASSCFTPNTVCFWQVHLLLEL